MRQAWTNGRARKMLEGMNTWTACWRSTNQEKKNRKNRSRSTKLSKTKEIPEHQPSTIHAMSLYQSSPSNKEFINIRSISSNSSSIPSGAHLWCWSSTIDGSRSQFPPFTIMITVSTIYDHVHTSHRPRSSNQRNIRVEWYLSHEPSQRTSSDSRTFGCLDWKLSSSSF